MRIGSMMELLVRRDDLGGILLLMTVDSTSLHLHFL